MGSLPEIKSFFTEQEALDRLSSVELLLPDLLRNSSIWNTRKIVHDEPEVHRLWVQLGSCRVYLHRIFPAKQGDPFFHFHPWRSIVRCLDGGYDHIIGSYPGPDEDILQLEPDMLDTFVEKIEKTTHVVRPGDCYMQLSPGEGHAVDVTTMNYSLMITDIPYDAQVTKKLSRKDIQEKILLNKEEKLSMLADFQRLVWNWQSGYYEYLVIEIEVSAYIW